MLCDFAAFDRLRSSTDKLLELMLREPIENWTKEMVVKCAGRADPGFVTRGKGGVRQRLLPGGFFAAVMVHQEYGVNVNKTLSRYLFTNGYLLSSTVPDVRRGQKKGQKRADVLKMHDRIQRDLPAWLLRLLAARGQAKNNPLPHILLEAMQYQGLHKRGLELLRSVLWTSAGVVIACYVGIRNNPAARRVVSFNTTLCNGTTSNKQHCNPAARRVVIQYFVAIVSLCFVYQ